MSDAIAASALQKMNAWYETLSNDEKKVINELVRSAITPAEERLKEDVSGYAFNSATCRGFAGNNAPSITGDLVTSRGIGLSAVFLIDGPPIRATSFGVGDNLPNITDQTRR